MTKITPSINLSEDNSGFIKKLFLRNVWPGVAAQILSTVGPIVCTSMAGSVFGKDGLAVMGLFSPFFFLAGFFGIIIASGSTTIATAYIAKDDSVRVAGIYTLASLLSLLFAAFLSLLMLLLQTPIISLLAGNGELREAAAHYYTPTIWYTFFTAVIYMPISWSRLMGKPGIALVLTIVMSTSGALLGALYTFVLGMELQGLAIAQAQAAALAFFVSMALLHRPRNNSLPFKMPMYIRQDTAAIILAGSPLGLSRLYRFAETLFLNAIFLRCAGSASVAVLGVLNMMLRFITAFSNGITGVQMPIAGVLREERDYTSLKQLARSVFTYANTIIFPVSILMILLHQGIAAFFGMDSSTFVPALICFTIYVPVYLNINLSIAWLTSIRFLAQANLLVLAQDMIFPSLFVFLLSLTVSGSRMWLYLPFTGVVSLLFLPCIIYVTRRKHKDLTFPLLISPQSNDSALSFSVECSAEKASEASEAVSNFCNDIDLDKRRSMLIALAIEEIITLIAAQSTDSSKQKDISVRMTLLLGDVVLRLRVGGRKFNPIKFYQDQFSTNGNIADNIDLIGVKFIVESAKTVYYRETFGVNNMVIII